MRVYVGRKRIVRMLQTRGSKADAQAELDALGANGLLDLLHPPQRTAVESAAINRLWGKARDAARERRVTGMEFTLTLDEAREIYRKSGGRCAVSGLSFNETLKVPGSQRRPFKASIDRIDSSKGYTKDNVRFVCCIVNLALGDWGDEVLHKVAHAIVMRAQMSNKAFGEAPG